MIFPVHIRNYILKRMSFNFMLLSNALLNTTAGHIVTNSFQYTQYTL